MRGYLLAGEKDFLQPYNAGKKAFFEEMQALQKTVDDNPAQVKRLKGTEKIIRQWIDKVTEPAIALRRQVNAGKRTLEDIDVLVSRQAGKKFFDAFREQIAAFSKIEAGLMTQRQETAAVADKKVETNLAVMEKNEEWVTHTYEVIQHANAILAAAVDMETGMRGYLLAGRDEFLAPYEGGSKSFFDLSASLRKTVDDNPAQVQLLTEGEQTIRDWQKDVTEPTIALRRKIGSAKNMDDMADVIGEARGKKYFDRFRQIMADFRAEETGLMETRQADNVGTVQLTYIIIGACLGLAILIGLVLAWLIGNGIANPITKMTNAMKELADGNTDVDIPAQDRTDEIGEMAVTVQVFKDNAIEKVRLEGEQEANKQRAEEEKLALMTKMADDFEASVGGVVEAVASASTEMQSTAQSMSATAEETSKQSAVVASAAEEASANVQTVSTATEELSASIAEIGKRVAQSSEIAKKAVSAAESTNHDVRSLSDAAEKIGAVVELITDIAAQTNLLALNATIEAARAGDAGKGFAVVASEVKNLANQTGKATDDIAEHIGSIQSATENAVRAIESITGVINEMDEISTTIAAAVEEQSAATQEIARNVQQAASGTQEVTDNISGVTQATGEASAAAGQVLTASQGISQQGETLREEVAKFLKQVRAA